ncbi:MAG: hypothetical protein ACLQPD_28660, partial [Desulfomonilaceae bacterium]
YLGCSLTYILCMVSQSPYGVNHRLESRMREIRTYGSEGGAAGKPAVPTPIKSVVQKNGRLDHSSPDLNRHAP